jgi:hypothetical protein
MYCHPMDALRGFHDRLRDGRVCVDHAAEFVGGCFERHCDDAFGKQFGGMRADNVNPEHLVIF